MKDFLNYAMRIGEELLVSGAEVHRVEDCLERICRARGATRTDVFIITSSMVLSVTDRDGAIYTQTRRIHSLGTDYTRLDALNALCRRICAENPTNEDIEAALAEIKGARSYPPLVNCGMYALIAASFALFFGGNFSQFLLAALIGIGVWALSIFTDRTLKNTVFSKLICTFFVTAAAYFFVRAGLAPRTDEMIIGNIMLLIPGIGFTNAMRDLFMGDSIAGSLRLLEAILSAIAIAAGYFLFVFLSGGVV